MIIAMLLSSTAMDSVRIGPAPWASDGNWDAVACAYCAFRPLAPPHIPPGHDDAWWYGTGKGDHNPHHCQPCKRFIAEGGDTAFAPEFAAHIKQALKMPRPRNSGK